MPVPRRGGRAVEGEAVFPPVPLCAYRPIGNEGTDPLEAQREPLSGEITTTVARGARRQRSRSRQSRRGARRHARNHNPAVATPGPLQKRSCLWGRHRKRKARIVAKPAARPGACAVRTTAGPPIRWESTKPQPLSSVGIGLRAPDEGGPSRRGPGGKKPSRGCRKCRAQDQWGRGRLLDARPQGLVPGRISSRRSSSRRETPWRTSARGPPAAHPCTQFGVEPNREGERGP